MKWLRLIVALGIAYACGAHGQIAYRAAATDSASTPSTITYGGTGTAANRNNCGNISPGLPAGTAAGNLLIATVAAHAQPTLTMAGWNQLFARSPVANHTAAMFWRIATGGDPTTINQQTSCNTLIARISRFTGVDAAQPFETLPLAAGNWSYQNAASVTTGTQYVPYAGAMVVFTTHSSDDDTFGAEPGFTQAYTSSTGSGNDAAIALYYSLPATAAPYTAGPYNVSKNRGADPNHGAVFALRPSNAALTINVPAGTVANDVMIASITMRPCSNTSGGACTTVLTAPAGWTLVNQVNQTTGAGTGGYGHRLFVYQRVATAAEPASYTWYPGGTPVHAGAAGAILSFSGVDTANPIVAQAGASTGNAYTHTAPGIDTSPQTNTMLVSSHTANSSSTWTAPGGMTERVDVASQSVPNDLGLSLEVNTEPRVAAGATGTRTATQSNPPASDTGATHMLALRPAVTLDHFSISHAATGVACVDQTITITGHDASHNPVDANGTTITLATSNGRGTWTGIVAGGGVLSDPTAGDGAATYTFAAGSSQVSLAFRYANLSATSETFNFNVSNGAISEATGSANVADDPSFTMSQAGFIFSAIPTQISGKASNAGFGASTLRVQAVRTDTQTGACTALFASQNRTVQLGAECSNPAACAAAQLSVNGTNIATSNDNGAAGAAAYTNVTLAFNASSQADTVLSYPAAGAISLHARYDLDAGVAGYEMIGSSNTFVVRPFALRIGGPGMTTSSTPGPAQPTFKRAGESFDVTITAVQWQNGDDGDANGAPDASADLSDNPAALNFGAETVPATVSLSSALNHPAGGNNPALAGSTNFSGFVSSAKTQSVSWGEVGFIDLTATSSDYLGLGALTTTLTGVGRFYPDHLFLSAGTLSNRAGACGATSFSYMNEGISLSLTLQARNASGVRTENYEGGYAKLNPAAIAQLGLGAVGINPGGAAVNLTARLDQSLGSTGSFTDGQAVVAAVVPVSRASPDAPDGPYSNLRIGVAAQEPPPASGGDSVAMRSADFNLDVDSAGGNDHVQIGASTIVRYGRLRLQNAVGSEKLALPIPMEVQYWNGAGFVRNPDDSCTALPRSALVLSGYTGAVDPAGGNCKTFVQQDPITFTAGAAAPTLAAPTGGVAGSVLVTPNLRPVPAGNFCDNAASGEDAATAAARSYLLGRWNDASDPDGNASTAYDDNPSSRAAFGLFGSQPNNFIYFRENF